MSSFKGTVKEDNASELKLVVDRPDLPAELLEGSRFNDFTRSLDRGLDDWFEGLHCEDDWENFEEYLESNGFSVGEWTFTFSYNSSTYSMTVSPEINYSSRNIASSLFSPELKVHADEIYSVNEASYDRSFFIEADNPGIPEPAFRDIVGRLAIYSDELISEGLETKVY